MKVAAGTSTIIDDDALLHDTFTDTDGTLLPAHTIFPVNKMKLSWVKANTYNLEILNNEVVFLDATSDPATKDNDHYVDMGYASSTIECVMHTTNTEDAVQHSIVPRYVDNLNSVAVQIATVGNFWAVEVRQQVASASSTSIFANIFEDVTHIHLENTLHVVDIGTALIITVLGETFTVPVTTHNTATKVAFRTDNKLGQAWDNLKIWKT